MGAPSTGSGGQKSITKQGHTAQSKYGSDPQSSGKSQDGVRDLDIQTKNS